MTKILFFVLAVLISITACSNKSGKKKKTTFDTGASGWFEKGQRHAERNEASDAVEAFEKVIQLYPYDKLAAEAQLQLIMANRANGTHESAIANADVFLQIYPAHAEVNHVILLKALSFFDQVTGEREEKQALASLATFRLLAQRAPEFKKEIRLKCISILEDILASAKMQDSYTYLNRKGFFPAIHRYREIINTYPNSRFTDEAYYRLAECFIALAIDDEARFCVQKISPKSRWHPLGNELLKKHIKNA